MSDSFATPWTVTHQAPLSVGIPREEYWSGLPFTFPYIYTYVCVCVCICIYVYIFPFPGGSAVKSLPPVQGTWVRSLGWGDPLEEGMATHSSILAWRILWTEEHDGL